MRWIPSSKGLGCLLDFVFGALGVAVVSLRGLKEISLWRMVVEPLCYEVHSILRISIEQIESMRNSFCGV